MGMWPNEQLVITQKGLDLQAKLVARAAKIAFTRAVAGAGGVDPSELTQQVSVSQPVQSLPMGNPVYSGDGKAEINVQLNNAGVLIGYSHWQIGIYASDPDEGEILF